MILMKGVVLKGGGEAVFCAAGSPVDEYVLAQWLEQARADVHTERLPRRSKCIDLCIIFRLTLTEPSIHTDYLRWSLKNTTP